MRVVVAAWAGSTNLGDEIVLSGLLRKLAARGLEVEVISVDPEQTRRAHRVDAVGHRDVKGLWDAVGRADALVFGGGGIVQDKSSRFNLPYHLSRPWLARMRRTPWAGVGLGVGPVDTRLGGRLTRTLGRAVAVSVRDQASADLLARWGVPGAVVAADLALSLPPIEVVPDDVVVVCLRPWVPDPGPLPVGASPRVSGRTPPWFVAQVARSLTEAARTTGLGVRFVALQADRDGPLHEQVAARVDADVELLAPDLAGVAAAVASGRAVVTMRLHAGYLGLLAGRPLALVDYTPKIASLAADAGDAAVAVAYSPPELARLPRAIGELLTRGEAPVVAARDRLREREGGNDRVLDRLVEVAAASG